MDVSFPLKLRAFVPVCVFTALHRISFNAMAVLDTTNQFKASALSLPLMESLDYSCNVNHGAGAVTINCYLKSMLCFIFAHAPHPKTKKTTHWPAIPARLKVVPLTQHIEMRESWSVARLAFSEGRSLFIVFCKLEWIASSSRDAISLRCAPAFFLACIFGYPSRRWLIVIAYSFYIRR